MATEIVPTAAQDAPVKLMTPHASSALADGNIEWRAERAKRELVAAGIDPPALLAELETGIVPVEDARLVQRLKDLWKSSRPTNNLEAKSWLRETGRLLCDLPEDILALAIDDAVKASLRGFMPTVGEIRALADPAIAERKRQLGRMRVVVHGELARPRYPWEPEERELAPEDRCTPEEAAALIAQFKIGQSAASA